MIKSNKEVTIKTQETYFLHKKPQKLKIAKRFPYSVSRIVPKKRKVASYLRNYKLGVPLKMSLKDESKRSFLRSSLRFYRASAILEPQLK